VHVTRDARRRDESRVRCWVPGAGCWVRVCVVDLVVALPMTHDPHTVTVPVTVTLRRCYSGKPAYRGPAVGLPWASSGGITRLEGRLGGEIKAIQPPLSLALAALGCLAKLAWCFFCRPLPPARAGRELLSPPTLVYSGASLSTYPRRFLPPTPMAAAHHLCNSFINTTST
jgi:hypothetical protein